jgi:hypothetical protein
MKFVNKLKKINFALVIRRREGILTNVHFMGVGHEVRDPDAATSNSVNI